MYVCTYKYIGSNYIEYVSTKLHIQLTGLANRCPHNQPDLQKTGSNLSEYVISYVISEFDSDLGGTTCMYTILVCSVQS